MSGFKDDFLRDYLQFGLGSMPKSDVDALVMHLLDTYGIDGSAPLSHYRNQAVSELLRTPVSKVKKLRYDAALKFGGRVEDQAKARLLVALNNASLELNGNQICLIIEDALAKNWLQGQLKNSQLIFEHSFNTEIVKVSASGLFDVLNEFFDKQAISEFRTGYEKAVKTTKDTKLKKEFEKLANSFANNAAKNAGKGVLAIFKSHLGL